MMCPRHRLPALIHPYGWPLCDGCFVEAIAAAEDAALEAKIRAIRNTPSVTLNSADAVSRRLDWE
jgi:hypothetical protein